MKFIIKFEDRSEFKDMEDNLTRQLQGVMSDWGYRSNSQSRSIHGNDCTLVMNFRKTGPPKIEETPEKREFQVWSKGFKAMPEYHGTIEAKLFKEACKALLGDNPDYCEDTNTLGGSPLVDNEDEAREYSG